MISSAGVAGWSSTSDHSAAATPDDARVMRASLGTIWIQEGRQPLDQDAGSVLEGAAAIAARLIERARSAPTQEALQIQRLLGLRGGSVDVPSLAAALSLPSSGPAAVIGLAQRGAAAASLAGTRADRRSGGGGTAARQRLRAGVPGGHHRCADLRADPADPSDRAPRWIAGMLDRLARRTGIDLRAAVAAPVAALADIGAARAEVDRVLDRPGAVRVTTLAESRTSVLLGEIADLVAGRDQLRDPRLQALIEDDRARGGVAAAECGGVPGPLRRCPRGGGRAAHPPEHAPLPGPAGRAGAGHAARATRRTGCCSSSRSCGRVASPDRSWTAASAPRGSASRRRARPSVPRDHGMGGQPEPAELGMHDRRLGQSDAAAEEPQCRPAVLDRHTPQPSAVLKKQRSAPSRSASARGTIDRLRAPASHCAPVRAISTPQLASDRA